MSVPCSNDTQGASQQAELKAQHIVSGMVSPSLNCDPCCVTEKGDDTIVADPDILPDTWGPLRCALHLEATLNEGPAPDLSIRKSCRVELAARRC